MAAPATMNENSPTCAMLNPDCTEVSMVWPDRRAPRAVKTTFRRVRAS